MFNIEYGELKNGGLECFFTPKNLEMGDSKVFDGKLEFNLENGSLEKKTP